MYKYSRWLVLSILLASVASLVTPVHAQVSITLSWTSINAPPTGVVTNTVVVTNTDPMNPHTVQLTLAGVGYYGFGYWGFSPNPVVVPPLSSVTSTLTIPIPDYDSYCPGKTSRGPFFMELIVRGSEGSTVLAQAPLVVHLAPLPIPLTVDVEPTKSSYIVGEEITLKMDTNMPGAEYSLKVKRPDGTVWVSQNGKLPGTITRKAAEPLGTYTAELTAYYCGSAQDTASFTVSPDTYDVTISLAGLPTDVPTTLQVDGNKVADMKGGDVRVMSYPIGTSHTFQVDQYVNGATGYRYYCASNSWTATAVGSYAFNYATQVYLDVSTDPSALTDVTPSGWFALESPVAISNVPAELDGSAGVKYRFSEWTVDGITREGNGFQITMHAPHALVAKYDKYFKLTVISDYGNPKGDDYYKSGDTATFSVESPIGIGIQQVFAGWTGDYSGKDPAGSVTMDGPKTVTATWVVSYYQLFIVLGAIAIIAAVAALLLLRRRRTSSAAVKPLPPPPPSESTEPEPETSADVAPPQVTKRCTNCGHELAETQRYCPECGEKQTD